VATRGGATGSGGHTPGALDEPDLFHLLVASIQDYAIFALDADGYVATWNIGAERLKGYTAAEIIGHHFSRFYTPEDLAAGLPRHGLDEALAVGRWENEGWRVRKDGSGFWADVIITALRRPDGEHYGFAKVTRDLTDRKRNEDRLRELDRMKTDLVAMVAHDLRAPMNVVQGLVHLLLEGKAPPDDHEALLARIAARIDGMAALVDEAFDLARIEAGEVAVAVEPFDVVAVARQVADDAAADGTHPVTFDAPDGVEVLGDPRRTWQVLANIVANARKFSPSGAPVAVAVERGADRVVVSVLDHGPGIDPADRERVFERFVRLQGGAGEPGGGLGLFIARSLVEAQGGRIWVESTEGGGATLRFTLPTAVPAPS
jgi:PAS domain S-box-containing protein